MKEFRYCTYKERKIRKAVCRIAKKLRKMHIISKDLCDEIADKLLW